MCTCIVRQKHIWSSNWRKLNVSPFYLHDDSLVNQVHSLLKSSIYKWMVLWYTNRCLSKLILTVLRKSTECPCMCLTSREGSGGTALLILMLGTMRRQIVGFMWSLLYSCRQSTECLLNTRLCEPQSQCRCCGEQKNLRPFLGIKPWFLPHSSTLWLSDYTDCTILGVVIFSVSCNFKFGNLRA
jgi:hypothetical protein